MYGEPQKEWLNQPYNIPGKGEKVILVGKSPSMLEKKYDYSRILGNRYKAPAMAVYQTYLFSEKNRINAIEGIKLQQERISNQSKRHTKGRLQFIFLFIVPAAQFVLLFNINTIRSFRLKSLLWIIVFLLPILEIILFMSYNSRIPKEMNIRIDLLLIYPLLLLSLILAPLTVVRMSRTN